MHQIRHALRVRFLILQRQCKRDQISMKVEQQLPKHLMDRLQPVVQAKMAQALWQFRSKITVSEEVKADLAFLRTYLLDPSQSWSISIGHVIPRDPFGISYGDASTGDAFCAGGGGFHSPTHKVWSMVIWSDELQRRALLERHPSQVHINQLEMVVVLLQLAAVITALEHPSALPDDFQSLWSSPPTAPYWKLFIDDQVSKS